MSKQQTAHCQLYPGSFRHFKHVIILAMILQKVNGSWKMSMRLFVLGPHGTALYFSLPMMMLGASMTMLSLHMKVSRQMGPLVSSPASIQSAVIRLISEGWVCEQHRCLFHLGSAKGQFSKSLSMAPSTLHNLNWLRFLLLSKISSIYRFFSQTEMLGPGILRNYCLKCLAQMHRCICQMHLLQQHPGAHLHRNHQKMEDEFPNTAVLGTGQVKSSVKVWTLQIWSKSETLECWPIWWKFRHHMSTTCLRGRLTDGWHRIGESGCRRPSMIFFMLVEYSNFRSPSEWVHLKSHSSKARPYSKPLNID